MTTSDQGAADFGFGSGTYVRVEATDLLAEGQRHALERLVREEALPRIAARIRVPRSPLRSISPDVVATFADMLVDVSEDQCRAFVEGVVVRGDFSMETIFLDLFGPSAAALGEHWLCDDRTFAEVTVGMGRLERRLRALMPAFLAERPAGLRSERILLAPSPGEQHRFGLMLVEAFALREGFDVTLVESHSHDVLARVGSENVDLIGLSYAGESDDDRLWELIEKIDRYTCNPNILILVGGSGFVKQRNRSKSGNVHAASGDARQAVGEMRRLLDGQRRGASLSSRPIEAERGHPWIGREGAR